MPVHPTCPEPLRGWLEQMEEIVQRSKSDMVFTAPEATGMRWAQMQNRLADLLISIAELSSTPTTEDSE